MGKTMTRKEQQEPLLGSGVNNTLREFGIETGAIEQQVRSGFHRFDEYRDLFIQLLQVKALHDQLLESKWFQQLQRFKGQRMSSFSVPPAVSSFWEVCKKYAAENPALAMTVLALVITCAVPVIVFLSFALITLLVTFIGFLCVEGTLLGIASVFLGGVLLVVGACTLTGVSCALAAYLVVSKIYTLITGDDKPQRYLAKLPLIGYLFANMNHAGANGDAVKVPNGFNQEDESNSDESLAHTD